MHGDQALNWLAVQFRGLVAEHLFESPVGEHERAIAVRQCYSVIECVDHFPHRRRRGESGPWLGPGQRERDRRPGAPAAVQARGDQHVEPACGARAVTGHPDPQRARQISRERGPNDGGDLTRYRIVTGSGAGLQVRHPAARARRITPVGFCEGTPCLVDRHDHAVKVQQGDLHADVGFRPGPSGYLAAHSILGSCSRQNAPGAAPSRAARQHEQGTRDRHPGGQGLDGGVDGHQAIDTADAQNLPDDLASGHQPQLRAADGGPLVSARHRIRARLVTGDRRGHFRDHRFGAPVNDRNQLLADLPGVGHIDMLRQRHDRLPPGPLHPAERLSHPQRPGMPGRRRVMRALRIGRAAGHGGAP